MRPNARKAPRAVLGVPPACGDLASGVGKDELAWAAAGRLGATAGREINSVAALVPAVVAELRAGRRTKIGEVGNGMRCRHLPVVVRIPLGQCPDLAAVQFE